MAETYAHITGWGMAVPERILTNAELTQMVDTSDEWIRSRTGIGTRHIAENGQTTASLATEAAINALRVANLSPPDVDMIIVSTSTPEHIFPATACLVQERIGAVNAGAFDLLAACTGFIYAVNMGAQAIRSGSIQNAVVIGAETLSRIVNWEDRNTCVLFGDGAGAFVLQASDQPGGVLSAVLRSDGSGSGLLSVPAGGSAHPIDEQAIADKQHYIQMNGREVFRFATRVMASATREAVEKANLLIDDIQLIIPHQANQRIIDSAAKQLKLPPERIVTTVEDYGNTSTASIPIATCEAIADGRLQPGDNIVLVGFGAGLTWGAAVAEWSGPFPYERKVRFSLYRLLSRIWSFLQRIRRRFEGIIWDTEDDK
ncbi:MAG: ketoacyl-ACP synthase III [Anaerolineales bacterium]|nr:ketoacyl-ACP synthase III [Anaerolineales bacterium]